jgi:5S rRNA maturation endonuclease (ribonuclease M5)
MRIVLTRPPGVVYRDPPPEVELAPLQDWPSQAREYIESRGVTAEQVERWGIGYAIEGRLQGRIVIPIRNETGWASYTARDFTGRASRRYLYPPSGESDSTAMFGEEHWPADKEFKVLVVVEGAMDALAVERVTGNGMTLTWFVAALGGGSSFRLEHARRIATWSRVIVATDPDAAGDKMAKRIKAAISRHALVFRCRLMEGTDAASTPPELLERWLMTSRAI